MTVEELVCELRQALINGIVPSLLIDPTSQDILDDPVIAEDGHCYSRRSILNWLEVSEGSQLVSPITKKPMGDSVIDNEPLNNILKILSLECEPYRKRPSHNYQEPNNNNEKKRTLPIINSLSRLASIYNVIDNYILVTIAEKHPNWRVPQLAVLGLRHVGKSSLLERLLMISVFPTCKRKRKRPGNNVVVDNDDTQQDDDNVNAVGCNTVVPLHIKLRHVHEKLAFAMPPVVMRVIDTNKKVQIGDAHILSSYDSAQQEISQIMRRLRQRESHSDNNDPSMREELMEEIKNRPAKKNNIDQDDDRVDKNRAIIVHIYSPLVPTLNLVDLPGLLPTQSETLSDFDKFSIKKSSSDDVIDDMKLIRPSLLRSDSAGSVRTASTSSRRGSANSATSHSGRNKKSYQQQRWTSVSPSEQRLEIIERYILSYPDSLYLFVNEALDGDDDGKYCDQDVKFDSSLLDLVKQHELESRSIGVLVHNTKLTSTNVKKYLNSLNKQLPLPYGYCSVSLFPNQQNIAQKACQHLNSKLYSHTSEAVPEERMCFRSDYDCRYVTMLHQAYCEYQQQPDTSCDYEFSCNSLVDVINKAFIDDVKMTWIPLALQELFLEKEKLVKMLQDLGHPAPPSKQFIHCPRVFYRKFDMNTPGNEAIVAKYGYDLDQNHHEVNVKDSNEICQVDDKFSQNFMNALLISICECLTYSQYITQTHHLGMSIMKPFLMAVQDVYGVHSGGAMSCYRIDDVLNHNTMPVEEALVRIRHEICIICEDCLTRLKGFWSTAVKDILFSDDSKFKLQRFPQLITYIASFLESSFDEVFKCLPDQWNQVLDNYFNLSNFNQQQHVRIEYEFTPYESSVDIIWDNKKLGHMLMYHVTTRSHLVSYHNVMFKVYEAIEDFFRHLEGCKENLVEEHFQQREELNSHLASIEKCIRGVLSIVQSTSRKNDEKDEDQDIVESDLSMRNVGLDIMLLKNNNFTPEQLREGGYCALEVLNAGFSVARLRVAGYPLLNDIFGGFTLEELRNCQDLTALHEIINQLINEEDRSLLEMVEDGYRLDELRAAGHDIVAILTEHDVGEEEVEYTNSQATAAMALAAAVNKMSISGNDIRALIDDDVILALIRMLRMDNHLNEVSVTEVKCAASKTITCLCQAVSRISHLVEVDEDMNDVCCVDEFMAHLLDQETIELLIDITHSCHQERKNAAYEALKSISSLAYSSTQYVASVGCFEVLVEQLLGSNPTIQGWAAEALCLFSSDQHDFARIKANFVTNMSEECIDGLVQCLHHCDTRIREASAKSLCNLAQDDADMRFIASRGALPVLVDLLNFHQNHDHVDAVKCDDSMKQTSKEYVSCLVSVIMTIRHLGSSVKNAEFLCSKTSCLSYLIELLGDNSRDNRDIDDDQCNIAEAVACALGGIAYCKDVKVYIAKQPGVVKNLVQLAIQGSDSCCEAAIWLIGCLACEIDTYGILINEEVMNAIVINLRRQHHHQHDDVVARSDSCLAATCWSLRYLTSHMNSLQSNELVESCAPAIPLLVNIISDGTSEESSRIALKCSASWALCSIASDVTNCMAIIDTGAVWPLVRLLRECNNVLAHHNQDKEDQEQAVESADNDDGNEYSSCKEAIACLLQVIGQYELKKAGVSLQHLRDCGVSVSIFAVKQRLEGTTAYDLAKAGYSYWEIRECGYSLIGILLRKGYFYLQQQEDAPRAIIELLQQDASDDETFRAMLEAELLGGLKASLHGYIIKRNRDQHLKEEDSGSSPDVCLHNTEEQREIGNCSQKEALSDTNEKITMDDANSINFKKHEIDVPNNNTLKVLAVRLIPVLIKKGISCAALLVHSEVMKPLLEMLFQQSINEHFESVVDICHAFAALSSVAIPQTYRYNADDDEVNFHELLLRGGVLDHLVRILHHPNLICKQSAVKAVSIILTSSYCYSHHVVDQNLDADENEIHKSLQNCTRDLFAADNDAAIYLIGMLDNAVCRSLYSYHDQFIDFCPVSATINILFILVNHKDLKNVLSEAGAILSLLEVLQKNLDMDHGLPQDHQYRSSGLLGFSSLPTPDQVIVLLRLFCWYHHENMLVIVHNKGLELLTKCLRSQKLSEMKKSDVLWIMYGSVSYGPSFLLSVGAVEEILTIVYDHVLNDNYCNEVLLEAALAVLQEIMIFDHNHFVVSVLNLARRVEVNVKIRLSLLSASGSGPIFDDHQEGLSVQLQKLIDKSVCQSTAYNIINAIENVHEAMPTLS